MPITFSQPSAGDLESVLAAMRGWPRDGGPVQLHPGDVGWQGRFGAEETARVLRTWSVDGMARAVGMLDTPSLVRLAIDPEACDDEQLAGRMLDDLNTPERGLLPAGRVSVELRTDGALRRLLVAAGWVPDQAWAPLVRDLSTPVEGIDVRVETVTPELAAERVAVQRAAFDGSTFTLDRWKAMAAGPAYADARCLLGYDDEGAPVAAATVWSAGPGRPGLIEPLGTHRDHRGHGHGRAITLGAAYALREMGASSSFVCTPSSNIGAVATYVSAGFTRLPDACDLRRPA